MRASPLLVPTLGFVVVSALGCDEGAGPSKSSTATLCADEAAAELLRQYEAQPSEELFMPVVRYAAKSRDPSVRALYYFDEYSKLMMPVPPKEPVDLDAARGFFQGLPPNDWRLLELVMRTHPLPWRRATIAQTMGSLAGPASLPALKERLADSREDEWVKMHLKEAIENIQSRAKSNDVTSR